LAFRGQHEHSLDAKDRLTIPARFRAALDEGVVLLEELDPCVSIYPVARYGELTERFLGTLNPLSREGRMMKRRFHGRSRDETLDSAGRVRIPRHLIDHAGLEGPCMVIGVDDHLEVWDPKRWAEHDAEIEAETGRMAEELAAGSGGEAG
jgi:transcriptional regulator MraZ